MVFIWRGIDNKGVDVLTYHKQPCNNMGLGPWAMGLPYKVCVVASLQ